MMNDSKIELTINISFSRFDLIVVGTGMVESVVAAAAARQGHSVLHLDTAKYYGGDWASFTLEGLVQWVGEVQEDNAGDDHVSDGSVQLDEGESLMELSNHKTIDNIKQFWASDTEDAKLEEAPGNETNEDPVPPPPSQPQQQWTKDEMMKHSRKFNIDLTPRLLFSRGDMVELLISSNISRYTEFKSVTRVMTMLDGNMEQVPSSRSDVFNTKKISVVEKRILMKFLTQCMQEEDINIDPDKTFAEYLKKQNLTPNLLHYVCHSIAMVQQSDSVTKGLEATRKFLSSLGRFGPTPFLWSMYGTGELPQVGAHIIRLS